MRISIRLIGRTGEGQPGITHFVVETPQDHYDWRAHQSVFKHLQANTTVLGLGYGLADDGGITLKAAQDQLTPQMVAAIRQHAEEALASLSSRA